MAGQKSLKKKSHKSRPRKSGGVFTSMRGGMKSMVGQGKKKPVKKGISFWDVLLFIAGGLMIASLIYRYLR